MRHSLIFATIGLFAIMALTSCAEEAKHNSFKVRMTDSPGNYAALNLQIVSVDAYLENVGWVNLSSQSQLVNVLSLTNGAETEIAYDAEVSVGTYTKIRIRFGDQGNVVVNSSIVGGGFGTNTTHSVSWVGPHEVEINIEEEVGANASADVLLDFHVAQSIYESANEYFIDPAVTEIKDEFTGVKGQVEGSFMAAVILSDGEYTYSTYIDGSGNFLFRGVDPGQYQLTIIPTEQGLQQQQVDNVIVIRGQIKEVGSIQM